MIRTHAPEGNACLCFACTIAGPVGISESLIFDVLGALHRVNHSAKVPVVGGKIAYFSLLIASVRELVGSAR